MAGKAKTIYVCSDCGYESSKWYGSCPGCGEWNTMEEDVRTPVTNKSAKSVLSSGVAKAVPIKEISFADEVRYKTGMNELDRVLGGGRFTQSILSSVCSRISVQGIQQCGEPGDLCYVLILSPV